MSRVASGTFSVEMKPAGETVSNDGVDLARMSLGKRYQGDLAGSGHGEMLTALTPVAGSAGYVAIERFSGTLHGRTGSFVLQHSGAMNRSAQHQLSIAVVPDSGTGELAGIAGSLGIRIEAGTHFYEFTYALPA